jgi:hypothetical protein
MRRSFLTILRISTFKGSSVLWNGTACSRFSYSKKMRICKAPCSSDNFSVSRVKCAIAWQMQRGNMSRQNLSTATPLFYHISSNTPLNRINNSNYTILCGPGSVVGIGTGYGLDGPGIESRWGARFSAPVQTGPGARPASCTMGTGSIPGIKSGQGVTLTPEPLLVPWS